jgi:hypothetical protein
MTLVTRCLLLAAYAGGNENRLPRGKWVDMPATEYLRVRADDGWLKDERLTDVAAVVVCSKCKVRPVRTGRALCVFCGEKP